MSLALRSTVLRYAPDIEQPAPDEQETIDGMTQQSETVETREDHAAIDRIPA